ncbi:MAG: glycoside hydrolase family 9 protein [Lewinellaceae bacterium]|nr:glycoside hydrolase family 9 protein [Lewinellaceae bacterium]
MLSVLRISSAWGLLFCTVQLWSQTQEAWLRVNQLGYQEKAIKVAVLVSKEVLPITTFTLHDALTDQVVWKGNEPRAMGAWAAFTHSWRLDFSTVEKPGVYYLQVADIRSPVFRIDDNVYAGSADFLLRYMRQQRSGYNPYLQDSCHTHDGFIVYHPDPSKDSTRIDVAGGWHDASDYLQYLPTSANAIVQMLFAYQQNPGSFGDAYAANGLPGANGIPDIIDEAKWGMDWLLKMNPGPGEYYNQIADDRDHRGMRLPTLDTFTYANNQGLARPAYFITGQPQGAFKYKNRTEGVASSAGKFAAAFALGSDVLAPFFPEYAAGLLPRAQDAFEFGQRFPGATQTAPCRAPYFYEESNWVDDMELAAILLHRHFPENGHLAEAVEYGRTEPVTPWMGADTAHHYQWYPFVNLGHYQVAAQPEGIAEQFQGFMRLGIERVYDRGKNNPFLFGVPFIWCSNNLVAALLTQCHLYQTLTGDTQYAEMEAALRDWLFGCNPWGTSMIYGLPKGGISPKDPHSAFTHLYDYPIDGGLVDGPVYGSIWNRLIGITLYEPDEFATFQSDLVVYHDDYGDYSTNEPTMDGTASLTYYLGALEAAATGHSLGIRDAAGARVRGDVERQEVHLLFTGHEYAEGIPLIRKALRRAGAKATFFFTGDFMRSYPQDVRGLLADGHYVGPHSDKHLLYCDWNRRDSTLVTRDSFWQDLRANYAELQRLGGELANPQTLVAPYEWYNQEVISWCNLAGWEVLNFTPGIGLNADYTYPGLDNYRTSEELWERLWRWEANDPHGLNGVLPLLHVGVDPRRPDPFYRRLPQLLRALKKKGYAVTLPEGLK